MVFRIKTTLSRKTLKNKSNVRIIGLSTALANATDVAEWIDVKEVNFF